MFYNAFFYIKQDTLFDVKPRGNMTNYTTNGLIPYLPIIESQPLISQLFGARPAAYKKFNLAGHEGSVVTNV